MSNGTLKADNLPEKGEHMKSVLIVDSTDDVHSELVSALRNAHYEVLFSPDGPSGIQTLQTHHIDALILDLSLRGMDGLSFLEAIRDDRPAAIITLSTYYPPYVELTLSDLGVGYRLLKPYTLHSMMHRIRDMIHTAVPPIHPDARQIVAKHLTILKYPARSGFDMLLAGVPLFSQDRSQSMTKELYPNIARLCNRDNWQQVESTIRDAKVRAWKNRDPAVWAEYFPDNGKCPSNRAFISRLADLLDAEQNHSI